MTTKTEYTAWTIRWRWREKDKKDGKWKVSAGTPFHVGRYWFGSALPKQMEGHHICAFETRRLAREALKNYAVGQGKGSVVKIKVTAESWSRGK